MKTIIALRGVGNSGKSTTICKFHDLMTAHGYTVVETNFVPGGGDFLAIFTKMGKKIGVTSCGDTYDLVADRLTDLINDGCEICVCACRSYDRGRGTNTAIAEFTSYHHQFVQKAVDRNPATQDATNDTDAQQLFSIVENMV